MELSSEPTWRGKGRGAGTTKCRPQRLKAGGVSEEEPEGGGYQVDSVSGEHRNDPNTAILTQGPLTRDIKVFGLYAPEKKLSEARECRDPRCLLESP